MLSGAGAAIAAIALGSKRAAAQAPADAFQPARHPQDEWMTRLPGKRRTIIDCATCPAPVKGCFMPTTSILTTGTVIS